MDAVKEKRTRRKQERTEVTRGKILDAATTLFSERGFEGVSLRDIEVAADVQRGLPAYHFKDKSSLWKAMADQTFERMYAAISPRLEIINDLSSHDKIALLIRFYVRFASQHPELSRLMSQEARHDNWRLRYLVDNHISANTNTMRDVVMGTLSLSDQEFMHWYYILVGAGATIFSNAPERDLLFGAPADNDAVVEKHADLLVTMLIPQEKVVS